MAVAPGTVIDISPLLNVLETTLRANVVAAANVPTKNAKFGASTNLAGLTEADINGIFRTGAVLASGPTLNCAGMAAAVMAEGVITTLLPGEFAGLGLKVTDFIGFLAIGPYLVPPSTFAAGYGGYLTLYSPPKARASLQPGDWVTLWNNLRYPTYSHNGFWYEENTILVGTDSYWGWATPQGSPTPTTAGGPHLPPSSTMWRPPWPRRLLCLGACRGTTTETCSSRSRSWRRSLMFPSWRWQYSLIGQNQVKTREVTDERASSLVNLHVIGTGRRGGRVGNLPAGADNVLDLRG